MEEESIFEMDGYGNLYMRCKGYKRQSHLVDRLRARGFCQNCYQKWWRDRNPDHQRNYRKNKPLEYEVRNKIDALRRKLAKSTNPAERYVTAREIEVLQERLEQVRVGKGREKDPEWLKESRLELIDECRQHLDVLEAEIRNEISRIK